MTDYVSPSSYVTNDVPAATGFNANVLDAIRGLYDVLVGDSNFSTAGDGSAPKMLPGSTNDFTIQLGDTTGARKFIVNNTSTVKVAAINSFGDIETNRYVVFTETTSTGTPSGNDLYQYAKDKSGVSTLYWRDDGGTERTHNGYRIIGLVFDNNGTAIAANDEVTYPSLIYSGVIEEVELLGDQSGSIVIDIWKCTYAQYDNSTHPVDGDSITAAAPPTITTAHKSQDSTLTGWTTTLSIGDVLRFHVDSCTSITQCAIRLKIRET
jgi:hypothetical protein